MDRQPASTFDSNDHQGQMDSDDADPIDQIGSDPIKNFKKNKQVIMGRDTLSHSLKLHNKILQELN